MSPQPYDPRLAVAGNGPPLVFVPGLEGTGLLYYRQIERLAQTYRVVTFRLRDGAADMDTLVADLDAIVEQVSAGHQCQKTVLPDLPDLPVSLLSDLPGGNGRGPVTVVGESFGGALALSYALTHPRKLQRLVILNSFAYLRGQSRLRMGHRLLSRVPWPLMRVVRRVSAPRLHSARTERAEIRKVLRLMRHTTREGYLSRLTILQNYDLRPRLGELETPTLFLAADQDRLLPSVQHALEMASLAPNAKTRILIGHGHTCLVAPDLDLAEILAEWGSQGDQGGGSQGDQGDRGDGSQGDQGDRGGVHREIKEIRGN